MEDIEMKALVAGSSSATNTKGTTNATATTSTHPTDNKKCFLLAVILVIATFLFTFHIVKQSISLEFQYMNARLDNQTQELMFLTNLVVKEYEENKRNLVLFDAVGRKGNLQYVVHSRKSHFTNQDNWDCLVFMYVNENMIADNHTDIVSLRQEKCSIIRTPGVQWGVFLQYVAPPLVAHYEYIAVHLDDVFLPDRGAKPINVSQLLKKMKTYGIDSIQPSIEGDNSGYTVGAEVHNTSCIEVVKAIETYAQIWTNDAWNCFYDMLHYKGGRGWCYDLCFQHECPTVQLGLDHSMIGYHLESDDVNYQVPDDTTQGLNLTFLRQPRVETGEGGFYDEEHNDYMYICDRLHCIPDGVDAGFAKTGRTFDC